MPTPDEFDTATIDLLFALRDSLTSDGPSRLDFWAGRAASAIETAAAGSSTASEAITTAARKLQIPTLTPIAAESATRAAVVIDTDYEGWAAHVARTVIYIVALANVQRDERKAAASTRKKPTSSKPDAPTLTEVPF